MFCELSNSRTRLAQPIRNALSTHVKPIFFNTPSPALTPGELIYYAKWELVGSSFPFVWFRNCIWGSARREAACYRGLVHR